MFILMPSLMVMKEYGAMRFVTSVADGVIKWVKVGLEAFKKFLKIQGGGPGLGLIHAALV